MVHGKDIVAIELHFSEAIDVNIDYNLTSILFFFIWWQLLICHVIFCLWRCIFNIK